MNRTASFFRVLGLCASLFLAGAATAAVGELPATPPPRAEETNTLEMLRAYLQLQVQIHELQNAFDHARQQTDEAVAKTARAVNERLDSVEKSLDERRSRELEAVSISSEAQRKSNSIMLVVAGSFASIGFVALVLMAYFLWRTIQRLAELSAALPGPRSLGPRPAIAALGEGDSGQSGLVRADPAEQASGRLLAAMDRLEKRIGELEHSAEAPLPESKGPELKLNGSPANGNGGTIHLFDDGAQVTDDQLKADVDANAEAEPETVSGNPQLDYLLRKARSLLKLDQAEGALASFDEALTISPENPEALVGKGASLEKLRKLDEALACYDGAITADPSLTIAYLRKGGLCNRMERFKEALECFEKALHTQEKRAR
jgi:tetratricopeptide (TPR) repeat protein